MSTQTIVTPATPPQVIEAYKMVGTRGKDKRMSTKAIGIVPADADAYAVLVEVQRQFPGGSYRLSPDLPVFASPMDVATHAESIRDRIGAVKKTVGEKFATVLGKAGAPDLASIAARLGVTVDKIQEAFGIKPTPTPPATPPAPAADSPTVPEPVKVAPTAQVPTPTPTAPAQQRRTANRK